MGKRQSRNKLQDEILAIVDKMGPMAAKAVLEAYQELPFSLKDALDEFYEVLGQVKGMESVEEIKQKLARLKAVCEANPEYEGIYKAAKREAHEEFSDIMANEGMKFFDVED